MPTHKSRYHCKINYGFKRHQLPQLRDIINSKNVSTSAETIYLKTTDSEPYQLYLFSNKTASKEQRH